MESLLAIALGPVQEFIATARRTRDLYAGSRLLSEAARAAAEALLPEVGAEGFIFPAPKDAEELERLGEAGIPNVLLVRVPAGKDAARLGEKALEAARAYLRGRAKAVFARGHVRHKEALDQVEDFLEGYYAHVPLQDKDAYPKARERVMALLAARKNTRDFAPVAWGGPEYKSSLDGARESVLVLPEGRERALRLRLGLREGEYLSGPDLLKRWWETETGFVSTTHMAAMPFWEGIRRAGKEAALHQGLKELAELAGEGVEARTYHPVLAETPFREWDVRLLYESRLEEFPALAEDGERLEAARKRLRALLQELGLGAPGSYYALLHADGDRMGEAIDRQADPGRHRALSRKLSLEFAQRVGSVVMDLGGGLVYSGGDDVLALLPLHTSLRAAWALAERFRQVMAEFGSNGEAPSLSVGLAVVHHLEPLQDALDLVRRAERLAKEGGDGEAKRNALCVVYSPRSGAEVWARGRWDQTPRLTQRLLRYADLLRAGEVPSRAAYELRELLRQRGALSEEALVADALRVLRRREMKASHREELSAWIRTAEDVERLATELILARPFAAAMDQAGIPVESREVWDAH